MNPHWGTHDNSFEWERYSSGTARKTLEKMGYKGGGLGKNEDGIKEAIPVQSKRKTAIFSSSITKGIKINGFNKGYKAGSATIHRYHGGKIQHIKNYLSTHLQEENPDTVVIVAGGNDLPSREYSSIVISDIADDIINSGLNCRSYGVRDVIISSVLPRSSFYYQLHRKVLNDLLRV